MGETGERYRIAEIALYAAVFLSPWAVVAVMSVGPLDINPLPDLSAPTAAAQQAPDIVAGLIGDLVTIAVGVLVTSWLIFRKTVRAKGRIAHHVFPLLVSAFAVASIYSGLRCRYELAIVITRAELDIAALSPFIAWQSGLALAELGAMAAGAVHFFLNRDLRVGL